MNLKNTLRLVFANLNIVFKAILYRLVIVFVSLLLIYGISRLSLSVIVNSKEMGVFVGDIKALWQQFLGAEISAPIELGEGIRDLLTLIGNHMGRIIGCLIAIVAVIFIMNFMMGLCNYTLGVMLDRHMSTITNSAFMPTYFEVLKRAAPFELFYTLLKFLADAAIIIFVVSFIVLTGPYLSLLSLVFGLWIYFTLRALFHTATCRLHPSYIHGKSLHKSLAAASSDKKNFAPTLGAFVVIEILAFYLNVTAAIATFGAGVMLSVPLSYFMRTALEFVVDYSVDGRKYYIDYDNIVVPKNLRSEDEKLLGENVDV